MIADLDNFEDENDEDCLPMPPEMAKQMRKDIEAGCRQSRMIVMG